ncbi:hypothetical protein WR25_17409 [Diploscapter pachys]|uniref:Uncharacterized protein n=1 Tax=Diploscapter pachys TaxID=2018661 RepID=A0A2A2K5X4_9BILA|nr:hypothetical protein WR25_17409 [Diploscapter pachys]
MRPPPSVSVGAGGSVETAIAWEDRDLPIEHAVVVDVDRLGGDVHPQCRYLAPARPFRAPALEPSPARSRNTAPSLTHNTAPANATKSQ